MPAPAISVGAFCAEPGFRFRLRVERKRLHFRRPARTSRGDLGHKLLWLIHAEAEDGRRGVGEASPLPGLSPEAAGADYEARLLAACRAVEATGGLAPEALADAPSMRFGIECALLSALANGAALWDSPFARGACGLPIHHLIWMDKAEAMYTRMAEGYAQGFRCIKLKVGALPWADELALLRRARADFPQAELRVDANGAFAPAAAAEKLTQLAEAGVACIEQPLRPGQWAELAALIEHAPLDIALDEELITAQTHGARVALLDTLRPHALVLKPMLHGGLSGAEDWAALAEARGIRWWANSALEGPCGHAALSEWCAHRAPNSLHGLGTGRLFADAPMGRVQLQGCALWESSPIGSFSKQRGAELQYSLTSSVISDIHNEGKRL